MYLINSALFKVLSSKAVMRHATRNISLKKTSCGNAGIIKASYLLDPACYLVLFSVEFSGMQHAVEVRQEKFHNLENDATKEAF